jgi:hypothetical protein
MVEGEDAPPPMRGRGTVRAASSDGWRATTGGAAAAIEVEGAAGSSAAEEREERIAFPLTRAVAGGGGEHSGPLSDDRFVDGALVEGAHGTIGPLLVALPALLTTAALHPFGVAVAERTRGGLVALDALILAYGAFVRWDVAHSISTGARRESNSRPALQANFNRAHLHHVSS